MSRQTAQGLGQGRLPMRKETRRDRPKQSPKQRPKIPEGKLFAALARAKDDDARLVFIRRHQQLLSPAVVEQLAAAVLQKLRIDIKQAMGLAEGALSIAEEIGHGVARA